MERYKMPVVMVQTGFAHPTNIFVQVIDIDIRFILVQLGVH